MLLSESYLRTEEYRNKSLMNILSSTLIEIGKGGDVMNNEEWIREEGGIENPTHDETITQECQQKRIQWLCQNSMGDRILEIGCNWGYILDAVRKYNKSKFCVGVDINSKNIEKALIEFPDCFFRLEDIIETGLSFADNSFDTVMLPDVLEHISMEYVLSIIMKSLKIATNKVLITLPLEEKKAHCFKHKWVPNDEVMIDILGIMKDKCEDVNIMVDKDFYYIAGTRRRSEKDNGS